MDSVYIDDAWCMDAVGVEGQCSPVVVEFNHIIFTSVFGAAVYIPRDANSKCRIKSHFSLTRSIGTKGQASSVSILIIFYSFFFFFSVSRTSLNFMEVQC